MVVAQFEMEASQTRDSCVAKSATLRAARLDPSLRKKRLFRMTTKLSHYPENISPQAIAVADRLHSAAIHLLRRVRKQNAATGEGPARLSALSVLVFAGPKTLGELAAAEQVKPPTMSRIVAGLARNRLVEITADSKDARRMYIRATPKGARLLQKGRRLRIESLAAQLGALSPQELVKLGEALEILQTILADWR
jgi:DNA-binding MarR family transcriptional regulator